MTKEEAVLELKENLSNYKAELSKSGWESDEVDEKFAEVLENFPWYQFNEKIKKSWMSKMWNFCIYSLLLYLAVGAVLQRNRRMKKNINDYIFDLQLPYFQNRIFRFLTLPIFKFYDLSKFHSSECLIHNPFLTDSMLKCEFCENLTSISIAKSNDVDILDIVSNYEIISIHDVPGYFNYTLGFNDIKNLFKTYGKNMDDSICKLFFTKKFSKVSDFFKLSEEEANLGNLSIGWRNCDAYGTRFYRKLFTRPKFISNMSEILLEKDLYFLQPGKNISFERIGGETIYIFQVQGVSDFWFYPPMGCLNECPGVPLNVTLKAGQILVYPNTEWLVSVKTIGSKLAILYLSAFDN